MKERKNVNLKANYFIDIIFYLLHLFVLEFIVPKRLCNESVLEGLITWSFQRIGRVLG